MKKFILMWSLLFTLIAFAGMNTIAQVHEGADVVKPVRHKDVMNSRSGWLQTTLTLTVDYYASEASWNLYNVTTGNYFYGIDQTFDESNQTITEVIYLSEGDYEVHTYDTYGDGGIAGVVEAEGDTLVSWDENDYDSQGQFGFAVAVEDWNFVAYPDPDNTGEMANIVLEWGSPERQILTYNIYRADGDGTGITFDSIDNVDASVNQYVDSLLNPGGTYSYYLTGVLDDSTETSPSNTVVTTAATGPDFNITPGSYNFGAVGLLDGEIFYEAENAQFSITNSGVGELQIMEEPYFFSGHLQYFAYEGTDSFPVSIEGPYQFTDDNYEFEVSFSPDTAGSFTTLLVITDNLDRITRTFPLQGSAYEIPDYDIVENANIITQDWGVDNDYLVEGFTFDDFSNDYEIGTPSKKDVVFHVSVDKDSFIEFTNASGVSDFAVFPESTEEFIESNNIYEDGQTAISSGSYYIIASGSGDFGFNIHIEGQEPILVVEPDSLGLGEVPIDAWHEGGTFKVYNDGGQSIIIEEALISDENGVFTLDHHYEFPVQLTTDTLYFDVYLDASEPGDYEGAFLLTDTTTTYIHNLTGQAYTPVIGDVIENPYIVEFDENNSYHNNNSVASPMHDNYHLEQNYGDVVYKFSYENDMIIDITIDSADSGFDPHLELYNSEEMINNSPDQIEPILTASDSIIGKELWAGTYYVIVAGDTASPDYSLSIDIDNMPAPGEITLLSPEDGVEDISIDSTTLEWDLGAYTNKIDVFLGTQYPPQEKVLDSVDAVTSITVEDLLPAQIYFWKVIAYNTSGSSESDVWGFTTELPTPNQVSGEIFDFVNVHLEWVNPFMERSEWNEDFESGEIPEGWSATTNASGNTAGWVVTEDGSSQYFTIPPHTYYAVANDDAQGSGSDGSMDYLITPEQELHDWKTIELTFDSYYTGDYGHKAYVELSTDGGESWQQVHEVSPNPEWTQVTVDLAQYNSEEYSSVLIGFHSDDQDDWASGWAVDNVHLFKERNLMNRSLMGYNVYQNDSLLNGEPIQEEYYDVYDLSAGTYTFGVSAQYNEGESEIVTIDELEILGMGSIEGVVTDVDTDEPLEGAIVQVTSIEQGVYDTTISTNSEGYYFADIPVLEEHYKVTASATGYADAVEPEVVINPAATTTVDFEMGDIPLPVTYVEADNNDADTEVTVNWGEPGEGDLVELIQHDNSPENGYFQNFGYGYGVVYDLTNYPDAIMEKIDFHHSSWGLTGIWEYKIHIVNWNTYEEIATIGPLQTTGDDQWEENISIGPIPEIGGQQVGVFLEPMGNAADDAYPVLSSDNSGPQGMSLYGELGSWEDFTTSDIGDFLMDLWITTTSGQNPVQASKVKLPNQQFNATSRVNSSLPTDNGQYTTVSQKARAGEGNDRVLQHYELYRLEQGQEENPENWVLLEDSITANEYLDSEWVDLDMGVYKYAVKAIYTITQSEAVISNKVGKDMAAQAVVQVSLNTGDSPEGAVVIFENVDEPEYSYERQVPPSGIVEIDSLWKGHYDLTVEKENYNTYNEYNIEIMEDYFIREVELQETLAIPVNLEAEVDCKDVLLTWEQGSSGGAGNTEFFDDFESGSLDEEWTLEQGTGNHWEVTETYAYEGTYGAYTEWGYNIDTWLKTPEIDISNNHVISFAWYSSYYWSVDPNDNADLFVKISVDGGNSWESLWTFGEIGEWENWTWYETTLDLGEFTGETVRLAFNLVADDNADVTIDNVYVGEEAGRSAGTQQVTLPRNVADDNKAKAIPSPGEPQYASERETRELLGYNIYRDGILVNEEPVADNQYLDEDLAGGTLNYEVSAIYTTGESALAGPLEVDVEVINPPENLQAEKISWNNVHLTWEAPSNQPIYDLHWDNGENYTSIGTGEAFDFDVASRWTPEDLQPFDGMYLTEVSFYPSEVQAEYFIRVWSGEEATLIADQSVEDPTIDAWNTVELDTPIEIDASQELWFGYRANAETGYPAGCDAGPALSGKGDMINDPDMGWVPLSDAYGLDYNWNISGTVTNLEEDGQFVLEELDENQRSNQTSGKLKTSGQVNKTPQKLQRDREFIGYNIYRNGNQINYELVTVNYYFDPDLPVDPQNGSEFEYYVEAEYESGCVSEPSNTQIVDYGTNTGKLSRDDIRIYPNPATSEVNIALDSNINWLLITDQLGQNVFSKRITDETTIKLNTRSYSAGVYVAQFVTGNDAVVSKRFIITK